MPQRNLDTAIAAAMEKAEQKVNRKKKGDAPADRKRDDELPDPENMTEEDAFFFWKKMLEDIPELKKFMDDVIANESSENI